MSDHPSMFALDQLALGDGSPEVKVHVDACLHCQAHVKQVTTLVEFPPSIRVRAMKEKRRTFDWRWLAAGLATAAAAVVVGVSMPAQDGTRPKGAGPALELFVKRGDAYHPAEILLGKDVDVAANVCTPAKSPS